MNKTVIWENKESSDYSIEYFDLVSKGDAFYYSNFQAFDKEFRYNVVFERRLFCSNILKRHGHYL
jgi:hypothetical protein